MRTRKFHAFGKGTGDFFALISPARNDQVKFVTGDAEIKALADQVKSTNLDINFPDPSSVRALRRGTVSCGTVPPPPATKAKVANKKEAEAKEPPPAAAKAEPPVKPALFPGPCTLELLFSGDVRSID